MTKFSTGFTAAAILLCPGWAFAEVADSSANGFTVKTSVTIQASPEEVYRRLVHNVGDWWSAEHTFSGDARNLTMEEKPMGCFCETLPGHGAVRHMEVLRFAPGKALVLSGALGPLQSLAATGSMTIQLSPGDAGTRMDVTYAVAGSPAANAARANPGASREVADGSRFQNAAQNGVPDARSRFPWPQEPVSRVRLPTASR
jgi:uncharacterized protein YndB with AHSA1/START domain